MIAKKIGMYKKCTFVQNMNKAEIYDLICDDSFHCNIKLNNVIHGVIRENFDLCGVYKNTKIHQIVWNIRNPLGLKLFNDYDE